MTELMKEITMDMTIEKAAYEAPAVVQHGSFEQITAGGKTGGFTDANFPSETPFANLTFS